MDKAIQAEVRLTSRKIARMKQKNPIKYKETRKFAENFLVTIRPLRLFLLVFGQLSFAVRETLNKPPSFVSKWSYIINLVYMLLFWFNVFNFLVLSFGLLTFFSPSILHLQPYETLVLQEDIKELGTEVNVTKDWEKSIFQQNFSLMFVVYLWFLFTILSNINVFCQRRSYLNLLNYWLFSVQTMEMEIARSVYRTTLIDMIWGMSLVVVGCLVEIFSKTSTGFANMMDLMTFIYLRPIHYFLPDFRVPDAVLTRDLQDLKYYLYKVPGAGLICFASIGARASIIHFLFYNRLLVCIAKVWNQRLRDGLIQNDEDQADKAKRGPRVRISLKFLLKDHFNIVQLFKMTEDIFGLQLVVYYFIMTLALIFELYQVVNVYSSEKVIDQRYNQRGEETKTISITLKRLDLQMETNIREHAAQKLYFSLFNFILSSVYIFIATNNANQAYNEGMAGFQILRRNCYLGKCDTTQERNFVHTLVVSFAPNNPILISASGYFEIHRGLVPAVMLNVMGYLVACYTLKPDTTESWKSGQYENLCRPKDPLALNCPS